MPTWPYIIMAKFTSRWSLVLIAALLTVASGDDEKFPHLLKQIGDSSRRLHLISEVVQGDHKIQVEEFLDLSTYSQLIQLKWHEVINETTGGQHSTQLTTHKINVLILNGKDKSVIYQYKPYGCTSFTLDNQTELDGAPSWKMFDLSLPPPGERAEVLLAKSIVSLALNSPYLVRMQAESDHGSKWVSGIAGLWLAAQFANKGEQPEHPKREIASKLVLKEGVWRLHRTANLVVDYYMQSEIMTRFARGDQFWGPELIVVRQRNELSEEGQHTINVFQLNDEYSDQLAENLFTLPIGFDCPANSLLTTKGLYLRTQDQQQNQLLKFELVASRLRAGSIEDGPLVDLRTIEFALVNHPLNPSSRLTMFSSREDHYKSIQDHYYKLQYKLYRAPESEFGQIHCSIERLHPVARDNNQQSPNQGEFATTTNSNLIRFNINKLQIELSEFHLHYLLAIESQAVSTIDFGQMRLINRFDTSDTRSELVFESKVPAEHLNVLTDLTNGGPVVHSGELQMRIVRVYEQRRAKSTFNASAQIRRGALNLVRVLLLVFDAAHKEKLAEVRLNLIEDQQTVGWIQRAQLFDLTRCRRNLSQESMQLIVRYPVEPDLLDYLDEHTSLLLHRFYGTSIDWLAQMDKVAESNGELAQKRRLGLSLNFLRIPRAEFRRALGGDLELHLTILEATSPLDMFELISDATFKVTWRDDGNSHEVQSDQEEDFESPLLVESMNECARLCQEYGCKVFAYGPSRECRMSHLVLEDRDLSCIQRDNVTEACPVNEVKNRPIGGSRVELMVLPSSQLYFERQNLRERACLSEASLAELSSYIAHASYDLDRAYDDNDDTDSMITNRQKRQATPERMPLFAFNFIDRSGAKSEYAAPEMRLLVPSEIHISYLPLVLNVARDGPQMARVSRSFTVRFAGKAYMLTALDARDQVQSSSKIMNDNDNERLFRDTSNEIYYNLKRVVSVSQDNCALLCHNIEEFNWQSGGEQTCVSFSYDPSDDECMLLVKSDFKFFDNRKYADDLATEPHDRVIELTSGGAGGGVGDPELQEQLMITSIGSIVAYRNYLPEFEGPLKLSELTSGHASTDDIKQSYLERGLELEWLDALVVESTSGISQQQQKQPIDDDIRERCAQKCLERNRGLKRADSRQEMCLALDHCTSSSSMNMRHDKQVCRLLLIRAEQLRTKREFLISIKALRLRVARVTSNTNSSSSAKVTDATIQGGATCNRYILSHLYEFNRFSQRQLLTTTRTTTGVSQFLSERLEKSSETSYDSNLETCALECILRTPANCLMFEFCQTILDATLERNCTMFKGANQWSSKVAEGLYQLSAGKENDRNQATTSFHKDCHVYVRREFNSIEQALSDDTLERIKNQFGNSISRQFDHLFLAIGFTILFVIATAILTLFIKHLNRRYGPNAVAARQDMAIMMTEINERIVRI